MIDRDEVTRMLHAVEAGDSAAAEELLPLVYEELRRLAASLFRGQRADHTLQPTALVHDAYLKLVKPDMQFDGRAHFLAVAATAMRQVLINHARDRRAAKRGGDAARVTLVEDRVGPSGTDVDLLELDDALRRLEELDPRQTRIVELRYFGGLSVEQTAAVLDASESTVKRDWQMARAWLFETLTGNEPS